MRLAYLLGHRKANSAQVPHSDWKDLPPLVSRWEREADSGVRGHLLVVNTEIKKSGAGNVPKPELYQNPSCSWNIAELDTVHSFLHAPLRIVT